MVPGRTLQARLRLRDNQLFLALTIIVGVMAGLSAVLFAVAIDITRDQLLGWRPSGWRVVIVPTLVSMVAGVLLAKFFRDARGSGIPQTETAFHLNQGKIPLRVPLGKFLTGVLCVGSGHSLGREGPSVQIGAGIASVIGRRLQLAPARVRSLVAVGAAAALAAAFNTPVAAVLFALEEIIGDLNAALVGSTVIASVTSVIVARAILGNEPLFHVPTYHLLHPAELAAYGLLGIVGGGISVVFCKFLLRTRQAFGELPSWTVWLRPAMGGLAVGVIALAVPDIMGVGYESVDQALNGSMPVRILLLLCATKLVATVLSYASGNAGGVFAPTLFLGAMAGGAVGTIMTRFAPFPTGDVGGYALVGMGTLFAGIIRAPMTSVFMVFEMTQDYQILVPLMVANLLSFLISRRFQPMPLYHALLDQDGVHLPGPLSRRGPGRWRVRHLMTREVQMISPDIPMHEAWRRVEFSTLPCWPVGQNGRVLGLITREQLATALAHRPDDRVGALTLDTPPHVHEDHPVEVAIDRFRRSPGLVVVASRQDVHRIEGAVTLEGLVKFLRGHPDIPQDLSALDDEPDDEAGRAGH